MAAAGFGDLVLRWLHAAPETADAREVVKVVAHGSDWVIDTEAGNHDDFSVNITYVDANGVTRTLPVSGEQMASLWDAVVQGLA